MKFHENSPMLLKLRLKTAQKISFNRFNGARQFACTFISIFQCALIYSRSNRKKYKNGGGFKLSQNDGNPRDGNPQFIIGQSFKQF